MTPTVPNILVYEYFSGGGWPDPELPPGLAAEGLNMLKSLLSDFRAWGGAKITTTRDTRLAEVSLTADTVIDLEPKGHYATLQELAKPLDAALIIAPETNGILARISASMEKAGVRLLGSSQEGIVTAANKWACHQLFVQAGLPTPDTWWVAPEKAEETAEKIGFPLVIKPVDGVSCEGVSLIRDAHALQLALKKDHFYVNRLLLQRHIQGDHASASVLVAGNHASVLSLNRQQIEMGAPIRYLGGEVPYACEKHEEAVNLVRRAVALVPGLKGYVGVDLLVTDKSCYLIEINPRITTSYIGLRHVVNLNLAEAIWNASMWDVLPEKVVLSGRKRFRVDDSILHSPI